MYVNNYIANEQTFGCYVLQQNLLEVLPLSAFYSQLPQLYFILLDKLASNKAKRFKIPQIFVFTSPICYSNGEVNNYITECEEKNIQLFSTLLNIKAE